MQGFGDNNCHCLRSFERHFLVGLSNNNPASNKNMRLEGADHDAPDVHASSDPSKPFQPVSVTESRPTNPLFIADSQPPPEEYGRDRYTSRQPWMSREDALVDSQGWTSVVLIDGASLSPFEGHTTDARSRPPVPESEVQVHAAHIATNETTAVADEPEILHPVVRRPSIGSGVLISLFALFAKGIPLILVMGGGYYTYSYFFGPIPMVDKFWRKSASLMGVAPAPLETKSKVSKILQQTRDVVKANDQRVHFASALADQDLDLDSLSDPAAMDGLSQSSEAAGADSLRGVAEKAKSQLAQKLNSRPSSDDTQSMTRSSQGAQRIQSMGVVEVTTDVQPSQEFFMWVNQATISGVRSGEDTRVFINDMARQPGETIYRPLGITIDGLDQNDTILIFRDKTGAKIGKRF